MKVRVSVGIGVVGCRRSEVFEIPEADLEGLDEAARKAAINEDAMTYLFDTMIDWGWEEVE